MLIASLLPLATVVTPNLAEARVLAGADGRSPQRSPSAIVARGARAVLITGGEGEGSDLLFDGAEHARDPDRMGGRARRPTGPGARTRRRSPPSSRWGRRSLEAARRAAAVTAAAIAHGLVGIGAGAGPVAVGQASGASQRVRTR